MANTHLPVRRPRRHALPICDLFTNKYFNDTHDVKKQHVIGFWEPVKLSEAE